MAVCIDFEFAIKNASYVPKGQRRCSRFFTITCDDLAFPMVLGRLKSLMRTVTGTSLTVRDGKIEFECPDDTAADVAYLLKTQIPAVLRMQIAINDAEERRRP